MPFSSQENVETFWMFGSLALGKASPLYPWWLRSFGLCSLQIDPMWKLHEKNAFGGLNAPVRRLRVFLLEPVFTSTYCDNSLFLASAKNAKRNANTKLENSKRSWSHSHVFDRMLRHSKTKPALWTIFVSKPKRQQLAQNIEVTKA